MVNKLGKKRDLSSLLTDSGDPVNSQYPLSVNGDSVYVKDLIEDENDPGTFTGDINDLFNGFDSGLIDNSSTTIKWFEFKINRPQTTGGIGIVSNTGNFSNVKIIFKDRQDNAIQTVDDSSNNTKYTAFRYPVIAKNFCCVRVEFHTTDSVSLDFLRITKDLSVTARLKALKPDNTETEINATTRGNLKVSLEEFDNSFDLSPLPVTSGLDMPIYDYVEREWAVGTFTETWIFKTGGSIGTTVATITIVYDDVEMSNIINVTKV